MSLKRKKENQEGPKPTGLTSLRLKPQSSIQDENPISAKTSGTDSVMEIYEPFLSDGFVSLNSDSAQSIIISMKRNRSRTAEINWRHRFSHYNKPVGIVFQTFKGS